MLALRSSCEVHHDFRPEILLGDLLPILAVNNDTIDDCLRDR